MKYLNFVFLVILSAAGLIAQPVEQNFETPIQHNHGDPLVSEEAIHSCGAPEMSKEEMLQRRAKVAALGIQKSDGITYVPVKVHFVRPNSGNSSWEPTPDQLTKMISYASNTLYEANTMFFTCGPVEIINSSRYHNFVQNNNDEVLSLLDDSNPSSSALNMYFVESVTSEDGASFGGFAYFPGGNLLTTVSMIAMDSGVDWATFNTIPHEFGHNFNLSHTFRRTVDGPNASGAENVARSGPNANCDTDGDGFCDTPADPRLSYTSFDCTFTSSANDQFGESYVPSITNQMSYYGFCTEGFTPQQNEEMDVWRQWRATQSSATDLSCTGDVVMMPNDLSITVGNNSVTINWTDVANNETGYLVERAPLNDPGKFITLGLGGVVANTEQYVDNTAENGQDYYYRIRPLNGSPATSGYSNADCTVNGGCSTAATCSDGMMNGDETGVDCGGSICPDCDTCPTGAFVTVTNTNDSGEGSLRAAIECANASETINFIGFEFNTAAPHLIQPLTPLPAITSGGLIFEGSAPNYILGDVILDGSLIVGNANGLEVEGEGIEIKEIQIQNFSNAGVYLGLNANSSVSNSVLVNNRDGVFLNGFENGVYNCSIGVVNGQDLGNSRHGILMGSGNTGLIGENRIGYNGQDGIHFMDASSENEAITGSQIYANRIGGNSDFIVFPNGGMGIYVGDFNNDTRIGSSLFETSNYIAESTVGIFYGNNLTGVEVYNVSLYCNDIGIDRATASTNQAVPAPVITGITSSMISGTATPGHRVAVYYVANFDCPEAGCQGGQYGLETVASSTGSWSVSGGFTFGDTEEFTALATNSDNSTSLFSDCAMMIAQPTCSDGIMNGAETGVDCGGPDCPDCPIACNDFDFLAEITFSSGIICPGDDVQLTVTLSSVTANFPVTAMLAGGGNAIPLTFNQAEAQTFTVTVTGNGTYILSGFADANSCTSMVTISETIPMVPPVPSPMVSCGTTTTSSVTINYATDPNINQYQVTVNGGSIITTSGGTFTASGLPPDTDVAFAFSVVNECGSETASFTCRTDALAPTCADGIMNGQETGVDCGGPDCVPCTVDCSNATFSYNITASETNVCEGDQVTFFLVLNAIGNPPFALTFAGPGEAGSEVSHPGDGSSVNITRTINTSGSYSILGALDGAGCSSTTISSVEITATATPSEPNFACGTINETALSVVWTELPGLNYTISVDGGNFQAASGGVFNVNGLTPGQGVNFILRATNECGFADSSLTCNAAGTPCQNANFSYSITASDETPCPGDEVTFTLDLTASGTPPYILSVGVPGQPPINIVHPGNGPTVNFVRTITANGTYRILGVTDAAECGSDEISAVSVTLNELLDVPDLACVETTNNSVTVQWSVDPRVDNYQISVDGGPEQLAIGGSFTVTGLTQGQTVDFVILANPGPNGCFTTGAEVSCTSLNDPCAGVEIPAFPTSRDFCSYGSGANLTLLNFEVTGGDFSGTVTWYEDANGESIIASPTFYEPASAPESVYAQVFIDGCPSDIVSVGITITEAIQPEFGDLPTTFCADGSEYPLPQPTNGITGSWFVSGFGQVSSIISDQFAGQIVDVLFLPDDGECSLDYTLTVQFIAPSVPDFGELADEICVDAGPYILPVSDLNGLSGFWSINPSGSLVVPNVLDISNNGGDVLTYHFNANNGCAEPYSTTFFIGEYVEVDFEASADTVCLDSLITFTYLGADAGAGEVVWSSEPPADIVGGDELNPAYGWSSSGTVTITLEQDNGGCMTFVSQTFTIEECIFCEDYSAPIEEATICANETFFWRGVELNTAGIYADTLPTAEGCDSIYSLMLEHFPGVAFTVCPEDIGVVFNPALGADVSWPEPAAFAECGPDFGFSMGNSINGLFSDTTIVIEATGNDGSMAACSFNISLVPTDSMTVFIDAANARVVGEDTLMVPVGVMNFDQGEGFQLAMIAEDLDGIGSFTGVVVPVDAALEEGLQVSLVNGQQMNLLWFRAEPTPMAFADGTILFEVMVVIEGDAGACMRIDFADRLPEVSIAFRGGEDIYPTTMPGEVCLPAFGTVGGLVTLFNQDQERVPFFGVGINLNAEEGGPRTGTTTEDGTFRFDEVLRGQRYEVAPIFDENHRNGISILDVLIIRNIALGTINGSSPTNPVQYAAANVSVDGCGIDINDLLTEMRLLSGSLASFEDVPSYQFFDATHQFPSLEEIRGGTEDWCEFPSTILLDFDAPENLNNDFIGFKSGDVNFSGVVPFASGNGQVGLNDQAFRAGETVVLSPVFTDGVVAADLYWRFDPEVLRLVTNRADAISQKGNTFHQVWVDATGAQDIRFEALAPGKLSDAVTLQTGSIGGTEELELVNLSLSVKLALTVGGPSLRVTPNPFSSRIEIYLDVEADGAAELSVIDVTGRQVALKRVASVAENTVETFETTDWPSGVYYVRLASATGDQWAKIVKQ